MASRTALARSPSPTDFAVRLVADRERFKGTKRISLHWAVAGFLAFDCAGFLACGLTPLMMRQFGNGDPIASVLERPEFQAILIGICVFIASMKVVGGYKAEFAPKNSGLISKLVVALLLTFSFLMAAGAAAKITNSYSRFWFFAWFASSLVLLPLVRWVSLRLFRRKLAKGSFVRRALSIGMHCPPLKPSEISSLSGGLARAGAPIEFLSLSDFDGLEAQVRDCDIDEVYITVPWNSAPMVLREIRGIRHMSANVYVLPLEVSGTSPIGAHVKNGQLQMHVLDRPIEGWRSWQKNFSDLVVASLAVVAAAPVMALVALAIKIETPGPILFRQARLGFNGRRFEALKFRSMYHNRADAGAVRQTSRNDDRVTRVGRFIRATSLDELPQLFNVLRGDMSIVGPRPHALHTTAEGKALDEAVRDYAVRHRVKPGLTGWAQVNGVRGELTSVEKLRQRVRLDIEYIDHWSLWFDLKIMFKTLLLIVRDPHAY